MPSTAQLSSINIQAASMLNSSNPSAAILSLLWSQRDLATPEAVQQALHGLVAADILHDCSDCERVTAKKPADHICGCDGFNTDDVLARPQRTMTSPGGCLDCCSPSCSTTNSAGTDVCVGT